ncbi:MAG: hypothetical protein GVY36_07710 [Verrucomicrobia bacterium]|jgi:hypothetical protein|nr:hypothetical protein [Verrucomicrobiota bacterium]
MDIFEILVPLIFAAIYFFGNMFSKRSQDEDVPGQEQRPRKGEDPEAAERQRRIQEEIRRKIRERRQAEQGETAQPLTRESAQRNESKADRRLRERREETELRRPRPADPVSRNPDPESRNPDPVSRNPYPVSRSPAPEARSSDAAFSWEVSDDIYDKEMKERLEKIEATKQEAEKLKKQSEARQDPHAKKEPASTTAGGALFRGSVIENLRSPNAARAAFVYGEVLGPPISQRKAQSVPGLER